MMNVDNLVEAAEKYLQALCLTIPGRPTGSKGNRMATDYVAEHFNLFGFQVERQWFNCIGWTHGEAMLEIAGQQSQAHISPYSLGCQATAPLVIVSTVEELASFNITGKIVLLRGEIAGGQIFPKNFPFVTIDEHLRIIELLESKVPTAIIAATSRNPELAGGLYPFPLFEDGDFDIPSVYITDQEGDLLAKMADWPVTLSSEARRIPSTGCNVIARKTNGSDRRITVWAHIDAKEGTPGALDNASGVATLLLLAELMAEFDGDLGLELMAVNGEDYYSAAGQQKYLEEYGGSLDQVVLGINIDGAGYIKGSTAYSLYGCSDEMTSLVRRSFPASQDFVAGDPWYQSDHAIFVMNGRPALALTTSQFGDVWSRIAHTADDKPELVDTGKIAAIAQSLNGLIRAINGANIH